MINNNNNSDIYLTSAINQGTSENQTKKIIKCLNAEALGESSKGYLIWLKYKSRKFLSSVDA